MYNVSMKIGGSQVLHKKYINIPDSQTSEFISEASRSNSFHQTRLYLGPPSIMVQLEYNVQINKCISGRSDTCNDSLLSKESVPSVTFQEICYFDHALKAGRNSKQHL